MKMVQDNIDYKQSKNFGVHLILITIPKNYYMPYSCAERIQTGE